MAQIIIESFLDTTETFRASSNNVHLVDDLIQKACELNEILPLYRYMTALYDLDERKFFAPNETIGGDGKQKNVQLRFRFHPVSMKLILEEKTVNFYYHQMLYYLLNECQQKDDDVEFFNQLLGLVATDYVRQLIENGEQPDDEKAAQVLKSSTFPSTWEFSWWKRQIVKKDYIENVKLCYSNSQQDLNYVKTGFIEGVWDLIEECRQECFEAHILVQDVPYPCKIIVGQIPFENAKGEIGPLMRVTQDENVRDSFPISQMSYLNVVRENFIEVHVRDEQAITVLIDRPRVLEFASAIDGYFRMSERLTACLCSQTQSPSILKLKQSKIHGPISGLVAARKLTEDENRQSGFLVRQSQWIHGSYYIDLLMPDGRLVTEIAVKTNEGKYKLQADPEDVVFENFLELVSTRLTPGMEANQIPPSDYDKTGLQLCKEKAEVADDSDADDDHDHEGTILNAKKISLNGLVLRFSVQQRVVKKIYEKGEAVFRYLYDDNLLKDFLTKLNEVQFWKCREIVPILGFVLVPPVCLVSAYMPLGPLHLYLRQNGKDHSTGDLGDAALCLAKAVWYLEENNFVHGKIRCRSAFVADKTPNSFRVKLGEPGLLLYDDNDIHWIPQECFSAKESVAYSQKADLYALGTAMWEIFNRGKDPSEVVSCDESKKFYLSGGTLPLADVPHEFHSIILDCWHFDPEQRKAPHDTVRDIHQILYEIYQPKKFDAHENIDFSKLLPPAAKNSKAPPLPPLRALPTESESAKVQLQRRTSTASQSSIASRQNWKKGKLFNIFRTKKGKDYDEFSNVSSYAPSEHTVVSELPDDCLMGSSDLSEAVESDKADPDTNWLIERKDIKFGEPLGQGFFGMVFKAQLTRAGETQLEHVAVKRMKSSVADYCNKDMKREIGIMKKLSHPNITKIIGIVDEDEVLMVMEYLQLGSLLVYLQCNEAKLTVGQFLKFSYDVADAMSYLEQKKIVHRDLAARNILVESESSVKIGDFGLARCISKEYYFIQTAQRILPVKWYAPESIMFGKFSLKSDVWSYGVALWEMFSFGKDPILNGCENPLDHGDKLLAGVRLPCPTGCPSGVYQIMRNCWKTEHSLRPKFSALRENILQLMESTTD